MGAHTIASLPAEITATPYGGLPETSAKLNALYREGWAEANWQKIFTATALDYRFDDPLVAEFSRWSLPAYFERLRAKRARRSPPRTSHSFFLVRWTDQRAEAATRSSARRRGSGSAGSA